MNYEQFRKWREDVAKERRPLRLDGLDVVESLGQLFPAPESTGRPVTPMELLAAWAGLTGESLEEHHYMFSTGVRPLLAALGTRLATAGGTIWLPADVYPVYWQLIPGCRRGFTTWPVLDLSFLPETGPGDAILLPMPLVPAGRMLSEDETRVLQAWLADAADRLLLVDAVYSYDCRIDAGLSSRFGVDQCILVRSLAKSWLCPRTFGFARVPRDRPLDVADLPACDGASLGRALAIMERQPRLPAIQQRLFHERWQWLLPRLRSVNPAWQSPDHGYLGVLPCSSEELLDRHGILAIPAYVFGSTEIGYSVVSCLNAGEAS